MSCETNPKKPCVLENACKVGGAEAHWSSGCLTYAIQESGSVRLGLGAAQVDSLVQEEFARWSRATCSDGSTPAFSARTRGEVECNQVEFNCEHDGVNVVMFHDQDWPHSSVQIALTTVTMTVETGRILDSDIEVNSRDHDLSLDSPPLGNPNRPDLRMVIAHELGHFLGLGHSNDGLALMRDGGKATPELAPDDMAGICASYPNAESDPVCEVPVSAQGAKCHGVKLVCPQSQADGGCTCRDAAASRSPRAWESLGGTLLGLLLGYSRRVRRRRPASHRRLVTRRLSTRASA